MMITDNNLKISDICKIREFEWHEIKMKVNPAY